MALGLACRREPAPVVQPLVEPAVVDVQPERATGCRANVPRVTSTGGMVVSAHPEASSIGAQVLRNGGSAADAAIAMAVALTLVEPQSSGLGGGAFLLHYDAATGSLTAWDGRETAPASSTPTLFHDANGPRPWPDVVPGGLSVGVPGLVRLLEGVHHNHGSLPWTQLWEPTALLADKGFTVTPRMARSIEQIGQTPMNVLRRDVDAAAYFLPGGIPLAEGTLLKNPALASTVRTIGAEGASAFYNGPLAKALTNKVQGAADNPGLLTMRDLADYRAKQREPVCVPFRGRQVCGHPPPTSGGVTTLQIVGMLDAQPSGIGPHAFVEAARLAWADRGRYIADPDAIGVPTQALLAPDYLRARGAMIGASRASDVLAGELDVPSNPEARLCPAGKDTTHLVVADGAGNVVSMTSSIENAFGSGLFVNGFLLNNQLTDFSIAPVDSDGSPIANAVAPCKRPRSSMSPIVVLNDGGVELSVGSPGGSRIIQYVARVVVEVLDGGTDLQTAIGQKNLVARGEDVELEEGCGAPALQVPGLLQAAGHTVRNTELNSGLHGIQRTDAGWLGGVDPRREGEAVAVPSYVPR